MSPLSQKLRELASRLRKEAKDQYLPKPLPNPVASKSKGDLGSLKPKTPSSGPVAPRGGSNA